MHLTLQPELDLAGAADGEYITEVLTLSAFPALSDHCHFLTVERSV